MKAVLPSICRERQTPTLNITQIKYVAAALTVCLLFHTLFAPMVDVPEWFIAVGRPALPLFLFAAAEGYVHTRSRQAYLKRLLSCSILMTAATFAVQELFPNRYELSLMGNAFGTLFISVLYMVGWDRLNEGLALKERSKIRDALFVFLLPVAAIMPLAVVGILADTDINHAVLQALTFLALCIPNFFVISHGVLYILLGLLLYVFHEKRVVQAGIVILYGLWFQYIYGGGEWCIALAAIPVWLYNGEKGRGRKSFFYGFYPVAVIALYILSWLVDRFIVM